MLKNKNMSKISIIGAGEVGSSCAYCLAEKDIVNELVMLDIVKGIAEGKALDMRQTASIKRFDTQVKGVTNDYKATSDSDIIVITSGVPRKPGMTRADLITENVGIIKDVVTQVVKFSPEAIIIVVSNPLDVLCYCAYIESKFPAQRVMGMSGLLDIARYKTFISEALNVSVKDIQALILGGHGDTMVPLPRYTTIGGIPIRQLMSSEQIRMIIERTVMGGDELIKYLGRSAWYAAGAAIGQMVESIIFNQCRVFPVCAYLNGEYGLKDIYLGVPVILGSNGIEQVIELELDDDDNERFYQSEKTVRASLEIMKKML